ncbi:MAG TPA: TfpX/TfpZ family type IV pilin accessory protein [Candidatus Competibacteraceae bacterium]|nr:TfpX/TfpZ family type IV pilin accessory protein [Candidatus Competibacteraceae bacterium]
MSRWRASGIHLLLSAAIACSFLALMYFLWYPRPYFAASGADHLLLVLVGVDVVLGPLITLIIFKSGKKGLKFDLAVIGLVQLSALLYGASVVLEARPAFLVFAQDRFVLVSANEVDPEGLDKAAPDFNHLSWTGPELAAAVLPEDPKERERILFSALAGLDVDKMPQYYRPYEQQTAQAIARGRPLDELRRKQPESASVLDRFLADSGRRAEELLYLPLVGKKRDMAMLIERASGRLVDALPIYPW